MPPLRRYLRITPHTVLEVRLYLDNPADTTRWLLNPTLSILPRILAAVRPLVLPKLQEENKRAAGGGGASKKKGWKDTVVEEGFEVAVFLTETSSRHSVLRRERRARVPGRGARMGAVGGRMTGEGTREEPVVVGVVREESGEGVRMEDVPVAGEGDEDGGGGLFVSDEEGDGEGRAGRLRGEEEEGSDDKKKLLLDTTYDGFAIYGRILCLVVKRRGTAKGKELAGGGGQAMMEEWISSTQMGEGGLMDE